MSLFKVGQALGKTVKGLREKYEEVVPENIRTNITNTTQQVIEKTVEKTNNIVEKTGEVVKEKSQQLYDNLSEQNQQRVDQFQETFRENVKYTKKISVQALRKMSDATYYSSESDNIQDKSNDENNNKPKM